MAAKNTNVSPGLSQIKTDQTWYLIIALILTVALMNIPVIGNYVLYPFKLFSTWIHEMSHGLTAMIVNGSVRSFNKLEVYSNTEGVAMYFSKAGRFGHALISSAGYLGTAIFGGILLMIRNRRGVDKMVLFGIGSVMILSDVFWVRNLFGVLALLLIGLIFIAISLLNFPRLRAFFYGFIACQTCLNSVMDIRMLYGIGSNRKTDAVTVAELLILPYWFWASLWLVFSILFLILAFYVGRQRQKKPVPA